MPVCALLRPHVRIPACACVCVCILRLRACSPAKCAPRRHPHPSSSPVLASIQRGSASTRADMALRLGTAVSSSAQCLMHRTTHNTRSGRLTRTHPRVSFSCIGPFTSSSRIPFRPLLIEISLAPAPFCCPVEHSVIWLFGRPIQSAAARASAHNACSLACNEPSFVFCVPHRVS